MKTLKLTKVAVLVAATFGLLAVPAARANLSLRSSSANYFSHFSNTGQYGNLICSFNRFGNNQGSLQNSYNCSYGFNSVNYCGGNHASQGSCLVLTDWRGRAYVWNICDWNGEDQIDCYIKSRYFNCSSIQVYGNCDHQPNNPPPTSCVPEPTTWIAGALLLLPLGIQGIREVRRRKLVA